MDTNNFGYFTLSGGPNQNFWSREFYAPGPGVIVQQVTVNWQTGSTFGGPSDQGQVTYWEAWNVNSDGTATPYPTVGSGGGSGGDVGPVVLDLTGKGVKITPLSSSNDFFDVGGDGRQHRTAWAGAGNGVLFLDVNGDNKITSQNEIDFTDWDPSAKSDMAALEQVFDTNHDGKLDAGDADWSLFKVMVTNPNGTTSVKTLARLARRRHQEPHRTKLARAA